MGCSKNQFKDEFRALECKIQKIAIPFFSIITALIITEYPIKIKILILHLFFASIAVFLIWISIRIIIIKSRKIFPNEKQLIKRISLQIILSTIISFGIVIFTNYLEYILLKFTEYKDDCCNYFPDCLYDHRKIFLATIAFTLLVNAIYEIFHLFFKLSETVAESERYKKASIEAQFKNLTNKLNPHFLFNSLNTLSAIIEEDSKKAVNFVQELSDVYRYVLNSENITWIKLSEELEFSNSYITLLKMRFERNLQVTINIEKKYLNGYYILPLTIQLLIENAIKHNEISDKHTLHISIQTTTGILIVSNDKQKRNIPASSTKVGLKNIEERYLFLTQKEVVIEDTDSLFTVKIPLIKMN